MWEYNLMVAIILVMVVLMFWLFRLSVKNKQFYYTSPIKEAELVYQKIKDSNPQLLENLADPENVEQLLRTKSALLHRIVADPAAAGFRGDEVYEALIKVVNEQLLVVLVYKKIRSDSPAELAKIAAGVRQLKLALDRAKAFVLETLSKSAQSRTFYLQKTILNYAEDLDDMIRQYK